MKRIAKKVLLIGWDAADWKIINPLIDAGQMPTLEKLINQGVMGNMTTLEPPFSPMLWTSIATGKYADKHGVLGFTEPDPGGKGMRPVTSHTRKTKAIWNILMQNGLKTHVLGWWPSNPVEPINGIMLSNHFAHSRGKLFQPWPLLPGSVHPPLLEEFFAELRIHPMEITGQHLLPFVPNAAEIDQSKDGRLAVIAKNLAQTSTLHAAATWIMDTQSWDFLAIYLDSIDHFCHGFMKYHPPRLSNVNETDFELYKHVVSSAYRYHDMMLESLVNLAGEETAIIIVSDHGFQSDHSRSTFFPDEPAGPAEHHRKHGIICMKGPGIKKDELVHGCSLLNITPTILTLFGLPTGRDMDGIPILQAFNDKISIETLPSWDKIEGEDGMLKSTQRIDPIADPQALQQLIDLGYIEDPGADVKKAAEKAEKELKYNLSRVYMSTYRYTEAIELLKQLYEAEEDQGRFALRLARCYFETGNYDKSNKLLTEFIQYAVTIVKDVKLIQQEYEQKIADSPKEKNKLEKQAHKDIRRNLTLLSNINTAQFILFDIKALNENPEKVISELESQFTVEKRPIIMWRKLANLYYKLNNFYRSEQCYRHLIELEPENPNYHNSLALSCLAQKKYEEAANAALDSIALNYYHPMAHFNLGESLFQMEDYQNAANAFEVCLKILPSLGSARNKLIELYQNKLDKPGLALKHKEFFERKNQTHNNVETEIELADFAEMQSIPLDLKDPIIVVSGLPRSGTSLMMQMLHEGGISVFTDNVRQADSSNPKGYYEHEAIKGLKSNKKWLPETVGKAVKIISQLLPYLPAKYNYKVIFMLRDLHEVVQSQHKMLIAQGKHRTDVYPGRLEITYKNQLLEVNHWIRTNHNAAVLYINHREAIENPVETATKVQQFLGIKMDTAKMTAVVDKALYRER